MTTMKYLYLYLIFIQMQFARTLNSDRKIVNNNSDIENNNLKNMKDGDETLDTYHVTTTENGFCVKKNGDIR